MKHTRKGTVSGSHAHHDGKHVSVNVAHGAPPKKKRGKNVVDYDDRPTSTVMIPKDRAAEYGIGKKVKVSLEPSDHDDDDEGEDLDDMQRRLKR